MSSNFLSLSIYPLSFSIKFFSYFVYLSRYEADENGNRASFKFGTGSANGSNRSVSPKSKNGRGDKNVDKSYLPPQ